MSIQTHVLYLTLAYVALGTLLLIILLRIQVPRIVKMGFIFAMTFFYATVFFSSQSLLGWAAPSVVPERFQILWARVVEPNPSRQEPGAIYIWVEELDQHNIASGVPRAFVIPYSPDLASRISTAQAEIKKGNAQAGTRQAFVPNFGTGAGTLSGPNVRNVTQGAMPGGDPSGGGLFDPAALGGQSKGINLIPLPPPLLPPKDDP